MARIEPSHGNAFAGDLLERTASGYAGFAASLMLARDPGLRDRQGPNAQAAWRSHLTQRVFELAAAVLAGEPRLFTGRVTWARKAFKARGQEDGDLRNSVQALRDVLAERLPKHAHDLPLEYLDAALAALLLPPPASDPCELDPQRPTHRLALAYLQKILEGNVTEAIGVITAAALNGLGPRAVYTDVLLPAQREVGRLWHAGEISIAEEHMVTAATQRTMAVVASQAPKQPAISFATLPLSISYAGISGYRKKTRFRILNCC